MLTSIATIHGHTFFHRAIRPGGVVVDLGANRGAFASAVTSLFDVTCYSVEANPQLAANIPTTDRLRVFNRAISDTNEPVTFYVANNTEASSLDASVAGASAQAVTVPGQTLQSFLDENQIQQVDLMKIDIEGAETRLFAATPAAAFGRVAQITMEFHDFVGSYPASEVDRMVGQLRGYGFEAIRFTRSNMNWLFYRPQVCRVSALRKAWATYALKPIRQISNKFNLSLPARL